MCFRCLKKFRTPVLLISHFKIDHLITTKLLKLQCMQNNCKQTFTNFTYFRIHLEKQHKTINIANKATDSLPCTSSSSFHIEDENVLPGHIETCAPFVRAKTEHISETINNLKKKALTLSLSLYKQNSMPRNQVIEIQNLVSSLLSSISNSIQNLFQPNEIQEDLECILNFCKDPFQ